MAPLVVEKGPVLSGGFVDIQIPPALAARLTTAEIGFKSCAQVTGDSTAEHGV
jgi:hypothetical protein